MKYDQETFPKQACPDGYSWDQLEEILDDETFAEFGRWMRGQTCMICQGRRYNHDTKQYEPDECSDNPHGGVAYTYDVHRFLGFLGEYHKALWD